MAEEKGTGEPRRLILGNGEKYAASVEKPGTGRPPKLPRTYGEARTKLVSELKEAAEQFRNLPQRLKKPSEAVFCLRLHPDVTAKSYDPSALITSVPDLRDVGSRQYSVAGSEVASTERLQKRLAKQDDDLVDARLVFVQGGATAFGGLLSQLDQAESKLTDSFRTDVCRIERFDLLAPEERVVGFDDSFEEGRAELVIHPSRDSDPRQAEFLFELFDACGIDSDKATIRPYLGGPTFVSCRITRDSLTEISRANPLRSAHPLRFAGLTRLRNSPTASAPKPPPGNTRSTIKVGVLDGGIDTSNALLAGHAEEDTSLSVATPPDDECVAHGTAVAGAVLHRELNDLKAKDQLADPPVSVVSFRMFPTSDPLDVDLYECVDAIEKIVPARSDIKFYNVSFGPHGPIQDDPVSRFTYVLDHLSCKHNVSFCVAVGNDGNVAGEERVQAPADMVHGLGIGAYTRNGVAVKHAEYSSRGPGRECGKLKPDVASFGGCENSPMHLVSTEPGKKVLQWGTSFAAPPATRLTALAGSAFDSSSPLLGRALVVHTAKHPDGKPDVKLGNGAIADSLDAVLDCSSKRVTVVFQGEIKPAEFVQLPVPWPGDAALPGMVSVEWTVAALAPVSAMHPSDYTSCCIEDTLYPDGQLFSFSEPVPPGEKGKSRVLHLVNDSSEIASLTAAGWKQSTWPKSESGNTKVGLDEVERRKIDLKWESVVRRKLRKRGENFDQPILLLHGIGRRNVVDAFGYVAVVTVEAKKFDGDLYAAIRNRYPALSPIRLRSEAETRIKL